MQRSAQTAARQLAIGRRGLIERALGKHLDDGIQGRIYRGDLFQMRRDEFARGDLPFPHQARLLARREGKDFGQTSFCHGATTATRPGFR